MKTTINHVNKIICFSKVRTDTTSQFTWCYFGHIGVFEIILVVHWYFGCFRSFECIWLLWYFFWGEFGHIRVFRIILVILGVSIILVIWYFQGYFGHFGVFGVILGVLSVFWELFWQFLNFWVYFGHFRVLMLFWSF